jgi:hypothetical protein
MDVEMPEPTKPAAEKKADKKADPKVGSCGLASPAPCTLDPGSILATCLHRDCTVAPWDRCAVPGHPR